MVKDQIMPFANDINDGGQATLGLSNTLSTSLMQLLLTDEIIPGSSPSYEVCKTIYSYHPLGAKLTEYPVQLAQSQEREITIPGAPEDDLKDAFNRMWAELGFDQIILNAMTQSRIYGISSLIVGSRGIDTNEPLPVDKIHELDLYLNVLDPLNTAGSLVLNQDPNASDYQKPNYITSAGNKYHPSRTCIVMNESPIYIEWSNSAFGFVGRSVYQRALYPLKSYVQTMITDQAVSEKAALLIAKMKAPGSSIDQRARSWFGMKRDAIKGAKTGNVVSIGIEESIESIDLTNLAQAAEFSRENILKNIAASAGMPASMINMETLAKGFGEGSEDAKNIGRYIDGIRIAMNKLYAFCDNLCQRKAWTPDYFASMQRKYPELYGGMDFNSAFYSWSNAFKAEWPNILKEPDSELVKVDDIILKAAIGTVEVLVPMIDPENRAIVAGWLADVLNERKLMFSSPLELDLDAIRAYIPPAQIAEQQPRVESYET